MNASLTKGGGVYIIKHPNEHTYKIGKANNICGRIKSLNTSHVDDLQLLKVVYPTDPSKYTSGYLIHIEKRLHKYFSEQRIRRDREFFKLPDYETSLQLAVDSIRNSGIPIDVTTNHKHLSKVHDIGMQTLEKETHENTSVEIVQPRQHQVPILNKIITHYHKNNKGILLLPPGYGKTYMAAFYIQHLLSEDEDVKILVITPQKAICDDFETCFDRCNITCSIINSEYDETFDNESTVTITTYASAIINKKHIKEQKYNLIIYDEAHHLCGKEYRKTMKILGDKLFMTATKKIYKDNETEIFDMSNKKFGKIIHEESLENCIVNGLLCDYKLYACDWKDGIVTILQTLMNVYMRRHIVLFFNRVKHSRKMMRKLNKAGLRAYHIDGDTSREDRLKIIKKFKKETSVLCNVNMVSEGVNIPEIDTIMFMENRSSDIGVIQNIGRGLRLHKGKDFCMIINAFNDNDNLRCNILPILYQHDNRITNKAMSVSLTPKLLYQLHGKCELRYLDKDANWNEKFNLCVEYEKDNILLYSTIYKEVMIGRWFGTNKKLIKMNKLDKTKTNMIKRLKCYSRIENDKWYNKFNLCVQFEQNGTIVRSTLYKSCKLGVWIKGQKRKQAQNELSDNKIELLSKLKCWRSNYEIWLDMLNLCKEYEDEHTLTSRTIYKSIKIGSWVSDQRKRFNMNKISKQKLHKLKVLQYWKTNNIDKWNANYLLCKKYEKQHKLTNATVYKTHNLGYWICRQRGNYRNNKLNDTQISKLQSLKCWNRVNMDIYKKDMLSDDD